MTDTKHLNIYTLLKVLDGETEQTVYVGCSEQGWVIPQKIASLHCDYDRGTMWASVRGNTKSWSLLDAGIIENEYNQHRSFLNKADAQAHADQSNA